MAKALDVLQSRQATSIVLTLIRHGEMTQTGIGRITKLSRTTLIKWLRTMENNQMLTVKRAGRQMIYRLNDGNPVLKQLKILLNVAALYPFSRELSDCEVYLYGSVARGEDTQHSDVDMLVIGNPEPRKISNWAARLTKMLGREVRPMIKTPLEYSGLIRKDRIFYENIERNRIRLI